MSQLRNIYCIVGKSGCGKSTIVDKLHERNGWNVVQSYTDRPERYPGETGHIFLTPKAFHNLGPLVAYTEFNGHQYGVTEDMVDSNDLYVIDPPGVKFLKEKYTGKKKIVYIYILAFEIDCESRMRIRGDSETAIQQRLLNDSRVFKNAILEADEMVYNDRLEECLQKIESIVSKYENALD